jgi:hypothetical protein
MSASLCNGENARYPLKRRLHEFRSQSGGSGEKNFCSCVERNRESFSVQPSHCTERITLTWILNLVRRRDGIEWTHPAQDRCKVTSSCEEGNEHSGLTKLRAFVD